MSNTSRGRFPIVLGNDPDMIFSPILNVLSVWISAIVDGIVSILRERERERERELVNILISYYVNHLLVRKLFPKSNELNCNVLLLILLQFIYPVNKL